MGFSHHARARFLAIATTALVAGSLIVSVQPAAADTAPQAPNTAIDTTVSSDALPTVQIDGVVWDQVIVGNTVYVGGEFDNARAANNAAGTGNVARKNLLAYNLATGELIASFNHSTNGAVKSLSASPDGTRLYVGGGFTQVDGAARYRIAAFNIPTGTLVANFAPVVNTTIEVVKATNTTVYLGGNFTSISGAQRIKSGAVSASNGAVLPFAPVAADGRVRAMVVSPDQSKVVFGGSFSSMNGQNNPGYGLAALDSITGASLPWNANSDIRNAGDDASIFSLTSDGDSVYGTGYHFGGGGTLEGTFRADWDKGDLLWVEDCHGDSYSAAVVSEVVYVASHAHYCGNSGGFPQTEPWTVQRAMAWSKASSGVRNLQDPYGYHSFTNVETPKLLNWWPDINTGTKTGAGQGAWDVTGNSQYVLYAGEFTQVNGKRQQGLVRFANPSIAPNDDGPRLSGASFVPNVVSLASGSARVSWLANYDRDNQYLKYDLIRDNQQSTPINTQTKGSRIWFDRPTMGYLDKAVAPGSTHTYRLRATDPFGNSVLGNSVSVTVASASASSYSQQVIADGATSFYRLGETGGTVAYDWAGFNDAATGVGVTGGAEGAIAGDSNPASNFIGDGSGLAATQTAIQGPDTFALEAWFKTTTTTGGKIVGFGNQKTGNSSSYDRHVFMDGSGRVFFGVYPGASRTVQSAAGLNDGKWHQVIANLGSTGMQLFIDGKRVDQRSDTTSGQAYTGFWRIGGDSTWGGDNYFDGAIDDVAIYNTPLTAQKVNQHLVLSGRESVLPASPIDSYGAAVFSSEPEFYWRLGESGGATAEDVMRVNPGTYSGGVAPGASGGVAGTTDTAASFAGTDGLVVGTRQYSNPRVYSLEAWFKTSSGSGGKIIGFGNAQSGNSNNYDRHIFMREDGRLAFGIYTGQLTTVETSASYNDGRWHQVVGTQASDGLKLYVDGALIGSNPESNPQGYDGYWRIGGDNSWGGANYFAGSIDEVAVYGTAITPGTVQNHWSVGASVKPNNPPTASFTSSVNDLTVATDASDSNDSDGSISQYSWNFGDGTTAIGATATHTYATAGAKTVTLTVTDDDGSSGTLSRSVTVIAPNSAPTAAFDATTSLLSLDANAADSADSDGTIASYAWQFGDGTTASGVTTTHTYGAPGNYIVTLVVTDNDGATASTTRSVTAVAPPANVAPTAAFTSSANGLAVTFNGSASTDSDGAISSYSWDFGDSTTGIGQAPGHSYTASGTYQVSLTVTDDDGATNIVTKSVVVTAPAGGPLASDGFSRAASNGLGTADAGGPWSTTGAASNYSVDGSKARIRTTTAGGTANAYLTGVSSTDTEVRVTTSLEQAASGTGAYASVIGRRVGTSDYRARVVIAPAGTVNLQLQRNGTVTLQAVKVAGLTYATGDKLTVRLQVFGTSPTTVRAKVWKAGTPEPAAWQLSQTDSTAELQSAGHIGLATYVASNATVLPLFVDFDDLWAGSTSSTPPPANAAPTASFATSTSALTVSTNASGSADADGTIAGYAWNFGDGGTATGVTASHAYAAAGNYTVALVVTDNGGATATTTRSVTVAGTPPANAAPVASFTAAASGLTAMTNATGSSDSDGTVVSYDWNFGDGGTATGVTASHTYAAAASYTVTLTVTDNVGATGSTTRVVTVAAGQPGVMAADAFGRTTANGLGSAETGGAWTMSSAAANYSVADGVGKLSSNAAGALVEAYLGGVSTTSTDVSVTTSLQQATSGGGSYISVVGRRVGTQDYRARIAINASNQVNLQLQRSGTTLVAARVAGITYATGDQIQVRLQVTGTSPTTVQAKVWKLGTPEPATWTLTTTDATAALQTAGSVGIGSYLSASSTIIPSVTTFDDFRVTAAQ